MAGTRIAINGFGRMGRLALRAAWDWPDVEFVHVNELHGDAATAAHLLTFDSVHGPLGPRRSRGDGDALDRRRHARSPTRSTRAPGDVDWDVDLVLECTGQFRTPETLAALLRRAA